MRVVRALASALLLILLMAGVATAGGPSSFIDLSVMKTDAPDPVFPGDNVTYTIVVENLGPEGSGNPTGFTDDIPLGTTFVSLTGPAGWTLTTPPVGGTGTVTATITALFPTDGPQTFTLVVQVGASVAAGTVITNVATGIHPPVQFDDDPSNNSSTVTTTVVAPAASIQDAAMAPLPSTAPWTTIGFALLLIGSLMTLVVASVRVRAR